MFATLARVCEELVGNFVKNIARQAADHARQGEQEKIPQDQVSLSGA